MRGNTKERDRDRPQLDVISYGRDGVEKAKERSGRKKSPQNKRMQSRTMYAVQKSTAAKGSGGRLMSEQLRENRRRKRRREVFIARFVIVLILCLLMGAATFGIYRLTFQKQETEETERPAFAQLAHNLLQKGNDWTMEDIFSRLEAQGISCTQDFLTVNAYSRPAEPLKKVKNVFVHYTANPGTTAAQNRSYFENLGTTHETSASSHFIIGYEGELVQCIPLEEIAYAVAGRNEDSVSIECCYIDEGGEFTAETYDSLVIFSALLLEKYGLDSGDLRRHYDENGKLCPKYYAENENEWKKFTQDVKEYQNSLK